MPKMKQVLSIWVAVFLVSNFLVGYQEAKGGTPEKSESGKSKCYSSEKVIPKERHAEVVFKVNVEPFKGAEKVRLWIPYPVSNEHQTISDVKVSGNFASSGVYSEGKFGNTILYAEWTKPQTKPELSFSFKVAREEIYKKNFPEKEKSSLPSEVEKFVHSSSRFTTCEETKEIANSLTKGKSSILEKVEAIYDYTLANFQRDDSILGCGEGKVASLLSTKKGKCADIHSVFVSLVRNAEIPAKEIFGIRIPQGKEGEMTKAYHCRVEFYLPGYGWVPIDASDVLKLMLKENLKLDDPKVKEARFYFFGAQNQNYIDFGTGRNLVLNPAQDGEELNYFMYPYAEVDGKALDWLAQDDLKYEVTFKEF